MAVRNALVQVELAAGKLAAALQSTGSVKKTIVVPFETLAADDILSKYRIVTGLSPDVVVVGAQIRNDAIAGASDMNLGLYEALEDGGAVIDYDCFLDGGNLSSAHIVGAELSALSALAVEKSAYSLAEVAGHTQLTRKRSYDIVLTADSEITAAGTIVVILELAKANG